MGVADEISEPEKYDEPVFRLICVTSDSTSYAEYAEIYVRPSDARRWLDHFKPLYEHVKAADPNLYALSFWDGIVWGDDVVGANTMDDRLSSNESWYLAADGVSVSSKSDPGPQIVAETIQVTDTGVFWCGSPKHDDAYFETPELTWGQLEKIAAGEMPLQTIETWDGDDDNGDDDEPTNDEEGDDEARAD